jgi:hypothetical protein
MSDLQLSKQQERGRLLDQGRCSASGGTYLVSLSETWRRESNRLCRPLSASAAGSLPHPVFWRQQDLRGCAQVVSVRRGALSCESRSISSACLSGSSYSGARATQTTSPLRWGVVVAWCVRRVQGVVGTIAAMSQHHRRRPARPSPKTTHRDAAE